MKLLIFITNSINVNKSIVNSTEDSLNNDHENNFLFKFFVALKTIHKLKLKLTLTLQKKSDIISKKKH